MEVPNVNVLFVPCIRGFKLFLSKLTCIFLAYLVYRGCWNCRETLQFLKPFSIDSADFPCRSPAISSHRSLYGQNICSVGFSSVAYSVNSIWDFVRLCYGLNKIQTQHSILDYGIDVGQEMCFLFPIDNTTVHNIFCSLPNNTHFQVLTTYVIN